MADQATPPQTTAPAPKSAAPDAAPPAPQGGTGPAGAPPGGTAPSAPGTDAWHAGIGDEAIRGVAAKFDSEQKFLDALGFEVHSDDWRAGLKSEEARKFAERSPDIAHLVGRAMEMQQKLSGAVVRPGKDASPEEVAAYRKRIGVPDAPEGYKFTMPEGQQATDNDKAFQSAMAKVFHDAEITAAQAKQLNAAINEMTLATQKAQVEADEKFAAAADADLRKSWPGKQYDANKAHAERALGWMFGDQADEARHMETKDGRFLLDHPVMLRALAAVGREMAEGGLVPPLSGDAADQVKDQIAEVRKKAQAALDQGNTKEANRLYQEEQRLIGKMQPNRPIVGAAGRAA